jgi:uncharacterized protein (TIGR03000 family)
VAYTSSCASNNCCGSSYASAPSGDCSASGAPVQGGDHGGKPLPDDGKGGMSDADKKTWSNYLAELDEDTKKEAEAAYNKADAAGKKKYLETAKKYLDDLNKPLTAADQKKWDDYLKSLEGDDKKKAEKAWADAKDPKAKRKLLAEIDDGVQIAAPATLVVKLPATAKLTIQGANTSSTSDTRVFVSPTLAAGKAYQYTLVATYIEAGKEVVVKKLVNVKAGKATNVSLNNAIAVALAK